MSHLINARRYSATSQAIEDAIALSIRHTEIVHIDPGPYYDAIASELRDACDGTSDGNDETEFWGVVHNDDDEPQEWRVHVEVP
jgi:hypothetical protein